MKHEFKLLRKRELIMLALVLGVLVVFGVVMAWKKFQYDAINDALNL